MLVPLFLHCLCTYLIVASKKGISYQNSMNSRVERTISPTKVVSIQVMNRHQLGIRQSFQSKLDVPSRCRVHQCLAFDMVATF
jgi:hypothetical protein